ncbi:hypothetical protein SNE40_023324 [Patella caerulea]|uniref:Uncharacterized protein n=1 Tax=Patella caerulea TaxID=87958 RepID=A0AAN8G2Q1_PATCE
MAESCSESRSGNTILPSESGRSLRKNRRHLELSREKPTDLHADVQPPDIPEQDPEVTFPGQPCRIR